MIGRLSGKLIEFDANVLLVDVSGICYEVEVSANVLGMLPAVDEVLTLHTHFVVREDAQLLYGFTSKHERELFRAFIKINGVGPKLGLALISSLEPQALAIAVRNNDVSVLTKVPGVGKKTAERLMVELKSRVDDLSEFGVVSVGDVGVINPAFDSQQGVVAEAEDALVALGYRAPEANRAVQQAQLSLADGDVSVQALVRLALRGFAKSTSTS